MVKNIKNSCKGKNVFVTGGAGFLGSEVVKQLSQFGAKIIVCDNFSSGKEQYIKNLPRVKIVRSDIRNKATISKVLKKCEYVVNLAALPFIPDSYHYPQEFFDVNTNGTINVVIEAIKNKKLKNLVHISSSEVYGTSQKKLMDERHPTLPHSTYAVSKLAGDRAVYTMHKEHGFPAVVIRPFNAFGPNITQPYIIPEIIMQILDKTKKIKLGNINSARDFTYVSDTAFGIISALFSEKAVGETINLGSGKSYKIKKIAQLISSILDKKMEITIDKNRFRPYDVNNLICDNRKAKRILNWSPKISFTDGLEKTAKWIQENHLELKTPFEGWSKYYGIRNSDA